MDFDPRPQNIYNHYLDDPPTATDGCSSKDQLQALDNMEEIGIYHGPLGLDEQNQAKDQLTIVHPDHGGFPPQVRQLLKVWREDPAAQLRTQELLRLNIPESESRQLPERELLKARIAKFDADSSISTLVAHGLASLGGTSVWPITLSSRDQFYRLRQEVLEEIFLPAEDEIAWDEETVATGLDYLSAVEGHRQREIVAAKQALSTNFLTNGDASAATVQLEAVSRLDLEAIGLYRVAYLGLRIFVCSLHLASTVTGHGTDRYVRHSPTRFMLFSPKPDRKTMQSRLPSWI